MGTMAYKIVMFTIYMGISTFAENNFQFNQNSLQFAAIIHRHGDRNPDITYPNDPHYNYRWPGGMGALTPLGSQQMFTLGQNLRNRYLRLLPEDGLYSADHMQVFSSVRERISMSSQSLLAGFMPPLNDRNPLPIAWQPIPVHIIPTDKDPYIWQAAPCPKYEGIFQKLRKNPLPEAKKLYEENAELFEYLAEHSGMNVTRAWDVVLLYDILLVQNKNNLTLPTWAEAVFPRRMRALAEVGYTVFTQTPFMKQHKGGPLVSRIVGHMREKRNEIAPSRSLYIYSGHDITLLSIIRLLNLTGQTTTMPEYGATLAFELHCVGKDNCSQSEVKIVYYSRYSEREPKQLAIPNCPTQCTFDLFAESIKDILNYDHVNACKLDDDSIPTSENDLEAQYAN